MIYIKTAIVIKDRKLPAWLENKLEEILKEQDGKRVIFTVETQKKYRSSNQNSFYYGVVLPLIYSMFKDAGNNVSKDEVHLYLKEHVGKLLKDINDPNGESKPIVRSSADLTTGEYEDWLTKIRAWAAQFGVMVPLPNELTYLEERFGKII